MQENTHWYKPTQVLLSSYAGKPDDRWLKTNRWLKTLQGIALTLTMLIGQGQSVLELLAVNLVSHLPRPLGVSFRSLVYPLFFAHTNKGRPVRSSQRRSQPFGRATAIETGRHGKADRPLTTQAKSDPDQTIASRSLYENCVRGCLKGGKN